MPGETDERRTAASPYSTGGGGTRLEHRLGTVLLVRLLTAEPVLELGERAPDRVAFQQSPATRVDDLVATASAAGGASIRLEIAVRRSPKFIRSNKKTNDLVAALVRADLDAERDSEPLVERRLAVAVSGRQTHSQEIAELAIVARGQSTAEEFVELIRTPRKFASRSRLDHLLDMVAATLAEIADDDAGTPEHRCWTLLRRLWIMQVDLETGHEDDWTRLVRDLKPYRQVDPDRPEGSLATALRVWFGIGTHDLAETRMLTTAAAYRLDAAQHLLRRAERMRDSLRAEGDFSGAQVVARVDELIHLVQEGIVALARCIALIERGVETSTFAVPFPSEIESHKDAIKDVRDAYEHIDERAFGRIGIRGVPDERALMIFEHDRLVRSGVIEYLDHRLVLSELPKVLEACRTAIRALAGGPAGDSAGQA